MDKSIEAMAMALDALESCTPLDTSSSHVIYPWYDEKLVDKAIAALKERLAQPADPTGQAPCVRHCEAMAFQIVIKNLRGEIERLKAPQRTEQNFCSRCGKRTKDIHTCTPPQENT
jgi:hypothetical protein